MWRVVPRNGSIEWFFSKSLQIGYYLRSALFVCAPAQLRREGLRPRPTLPSDNSRMSSSRVMTLML